MHASEVTPEVAERSNELYWDSPQSVNQIADDLDLSKGTLYGILAPRPAGLGCPLCGDEVGWANRTARDRDNLECPTCDWDGSADETVGYEAEDPDVETEATEPKATAAESKPGKPRRRRTENRDLPVPTPPAPQGSTSLSTIAGGALIGAAVGLALVLWARRR